METDILKVVDVVLGFPPIFFYFFEFFWWLISNTGLRDKGKVSYFHPKILVEVFYLLQILREDTKGDVEARGFCDISELVGDWLD